MRERSFRTGLGRSLKQGRRAQGLTQRKLAEEAGITEKYLSRIELGLVTPSALVALRLTHALGLSLGDLVRSSPRPVSAGAAAIARVLRDRSEDELDRAHRVLVELFR
jgi:transcriptional regulator with XRE-family HTH domain